MKQFVIGKNDAGQRVDRFLMKMGNRLPPALLYKAFRKRDVKIFRKRCHPEDYLKEGDILTVYLDETLFFSKRGGELNHFPPIPILYEDAQILVADKPAGLLSHSASEKAGEDTAIGRIRYHLFLKGEYQPLQEQSFAPALSGRLDRNTEGILLCAKTAEALRELNRLNRERRIEKQYLALVEGCLPERGEITGALFKDQKQNRVFLSEEGKEAMTRYERVDFLKNGQGRVESLAKVDLITGRSHQIRAHFASIGHPLVGDKKYGARADSRYSHQMLCAYRVKIQPEAVTCFSPDGQRDFFCIPSWSRVFLKN